MQQPLHPRLPAAPPLRPGRFSAPVPIDGRRSGGQTSAHFTHALHNPRDRPSLSREKKLREVLLLIFCDPIPKECLRLWLFTRGDWKQALHWLDVSGLAFYFLDRLEQQELSDIVPATVLARLRQKLADNTERSASMMDEWIELHRSFHGAGLSCATLKGFSLYPFSVPRPELRSQLDLDFLVAEDDAPEARRILEDRGYCLHAISGRSWEFKRSAPTRITLDDLYKTSSRRSVELHLESSIAVSPLLRRIEWRGFRDVAIPTLCPVDLFLGQGLHLFKHVCSSCLRAAHLIEFRRHVLERYDDLAFWNELQRLAEADPRSPIGLGVVTLLIARLMGPFAPEALTRWTVGRVPPAARLWIDTYGHDFILSDFPGTKLYLLLLQALAPAGIETKRSFRETLVPQKLPPAIALTVPGEGAVARLRRNWTQLHFISIRARFHVVQGLHYLRESRRWQKCLRRAAS